MKAILNFLFTLFVLNFWILKYLDVLRRQDYQTALRLQKGWKFSKAVFFMGDADNFYDFRWHDNKGKLLPVTVMDVWVISLWQAEAVY